ncbi:MAG TPA: hypothetical protein V6D43_06450 [Candidatus Sericytochromatia bacterium]
MYEKGLRLQLVWFYAIAPHSEPGELCRVMIASSTGFRLMDRAIAPFSHSLLLTSFGTYQIRWEF